MLEESVTIRMLTFEKLPSHITFDPDVEKQYDLIRQSTHDGTSLFTKQLLDEAFISLINKTTYHIPTAPADMSTVKDIHYVIGEVELKSEFGMKDLKIGRYPGQTDTITIPVKCIYILKEELG